MSKPSPNSDFARIKRLPPYVFSIVGELKQAARARGEDIIDFGMGNPDQDTPQHIVDKLVEVSQRGGTHRYSTSRGVPRLRKAICDWYRRRYAVELDPETEAIVTMGSKEGLAHLMLAILEHGDQVLVPNPAYPIHPYGAVIAGADVRHVRMMPDTDFFAELEKAIKESWPRPKMVLLNFPANPTTQCVELEFFERIVAMAREYDLWIVQDLAYADLVFDGYRAPSILQVPGARDVAVECFSHVQELQHAGLADRLHVRQRDADRRARADEVLSRLRHVHAGAGRGDRRLNGPAGLREGNPRDLPRAPGHPLRRPQRYRLGRRQAQGDDVRLGAHTRALSAHGLARVHQEAAGRRPRGGVARRRFR